MFAPHYRDWLTGALRYWLAEVPGTEDLRAWFPKLAADFFLSQSWHRSTDPETAAAWGKRLAAIAATEAEAADAFAWASGAHHFDSAGRRVFSRPDYLSRIVWRILTRRKRQAGPPTAPPTPADPVEPAGSVFPPNWPRPTPRRPAEVDR